MITDSFDPKTPALMTPGHFYGEQKHLCDVCIVTFSHVIFSRVLESYPCTLAATIYAANGKREIYTFLLEGKTVGVYLSGIGSTLAANDVIEVNWLTGATKFIMFGSAGSLNREATTGKYVIPTAAYRDEGMSYHYAPPADYIDVPNSTVLERLFAEWKLPYVTGRVWTTDAFYRETRGQVQKRQAEGCLAVEMELAGVQAVCDFHGLSLYNFLVTGDVLDGPAYEVGTLSGANHKTDKFYLALEIAKRI